MKPRLLDLFCGAGGAAKGYQRAGFYVVGVDINPQPHYCGDEFHQADALTFPLDGFDAIHASPPCQAYTALRSRHQAKSYPDLVAPVRQRLQTSGRPYTIENVPGAPLNYAVMLCGAMFGLKVYRHRLFETSMLLLGPAHVSHDDTTPGVGRGKSGRGFISVAGVGGFGFPGGFDYAKAAMGIDWMSRAELSQAIPPAYTEWIGRQLLTVIEHGKAA